VIENEPGNLLLLALILRSFGHTVLEADSPDEGLRASLEHPGPIHALVTKAVLDNLNASEVVARLQTVHPQIRGLLIFEESADELPDQNTCGCAYLRKPFRLEVLADSIRALLDAPKMRLVAVNPHPSNFATVAMPRSCAMSPGLRRLALIPSGPDVALDRLSPPMRAVTWSCLTILLAATVVPIQVRSTRGSSAPASTRVGSAQSLSLTLTGEGDRLHVIWDGATPMIQPGRCGVLWITDGNVQRRIMLDVSQMHAGSLFYWPSANDVSFRLNLSDTNIGCGEANSIIDSVSGVQTADGRARPVQQAQTADLRNGHDTPHMVRRRAILSGQPVHVSHRANPISARSRPVLASLKERPEGPLFTPPPVERVIEKQVTAATTSSISKAAPESFSTVTVEAGAELHSGGLMDKIPPLLRRLHPAPEFVPPRPVHETTPMVAESLRRTLKTEVPLDVRVYINRSGKVDYAELVSDITGGNRDFATLAVFDARHWEFTPARSGKRIVPGRAILHYRFGNPVLAISRD
jgi:hypothetical protein